MLQKSGIALGSTINNFLSFIPKTNCLSLTEWKKDGKVYIAVVCECGNRKMTIHEAGLRCQDCGILHDHVAYEKMRRLAIFKGETLARSSLKFLENQKLKPNKNTKLLLWIPSLRRIVTKDLLRRMKFKKRLA